MEDAPENQPAQVAVFFAVAHYIIGFALFDIAEIVNHIVRLNVDRAVERRRHERIVVVRRVVPAGNHARRDVAGGASAAVVIDVPADFVVGVHAVAAERPVEPVHI